MYIILDIYHNVFRFAGIIEYSVPEKHILPHMFGTAADLLATTTK